jgi:hypothetical protein
MWQIHASTIQQVTKEEEEDTPHIGIVAQCKGVG